MPSFAYKAINEEGEKISGVMEAQSVEAVQNLLMANGSVPVAIRRTKKGERQRRVGFLAQLAGVKLPDLLIFTKQINTLIRAGLPITRALDVLKEQTENPVLQKTIGDINEDINKGDTLSSAFARHPKIFSSLYCNLVNAGEISGSLPNVLERTGFILEHEHKVREDVRSALAYPKIVVTALCGAFFFLLTFVIPKFVQVFKGAGLELPIPTKICIALYTMIATYWYLLLGGSAAVFFMVRFYLRTPQGTLAKDSFLLKLPIVGHLFVKSAMSRFAYILSILMASGVSILDSINIISETIGNRAITREFEQIKHYMQEGSGIASPLKKAKFFPPMVVNMIAIGEESGSLEAMLREIARHYDEEVEYSVKNLSEAIGPILIVALTVVVGFFALAIFLPMWDLTKMVR